MGELILHIGTTKTGTTSLQGFFFRNRKLLEGIKRPLRAVRDGLGKR